VQKKLEIQLLLKIALTEKESLQSLHQLNDCLKENFVNEKLKKKDRKIKELSSDLEKLELLPKQLLDNLNQLA